MRNTLRLHHRLASILPLLSAMSLLQTLLLRSAMIPSETVPTVRRMLLSRSLTREVSSTAWRMQQSDTQPCRHLPLSRCRRLRMAILSSCLLPSRTRPCTHLNPYNITHHRQPPLLVLHLAAQAVIENCVLPRRRTAQLPQRHPVRGGNSIDRASFGTMICT